jgi:hypothetical protein
MEKQQYKKRPEARQAIWMFETEKNGVEVAKVSWAPLVFPLCPNSCSFPFPFVWSSC